MTFSYGDRVKVVEVPSKYVTGYPELKCATGTVKFCYHNNVAVRIDEFSHPYNKLGYFYFRPSELCLDTISTLLGGPEHHRVDLENTRKMREIYENLIETEYERTIKTEEENIMSNVPMLPNFRVAGCVYNNTVKSYAFALYEDDVNVGDKVVVRNSDGGLQIVEVATINKLPKDMVKNGCEVICRVDFTAYAARKAKAVQIHELKQEMDAKVAQLQATALYELMAEKDPALKAMLEKFKTLTM